LSERHIERKLLKEVKDLKRMLEIMNSRIISDTYNANHSIHKIEQSNERYRAKKNKKK